MTRRLLRNAPTILGVGIDVTTTLNIQRIGSPDLNLNSRHNRA
jgi:K+-sensing histidine kinase KdpD